MSSDILLSESLDTPINAIDMESKMNLASLGKQRDKALANPGSNTIAVVNGTQIATDTACGAAWIEKYQHPPSERRSEFRGIPDRNATTSVDLEYRLQDELTVDTGTGGNLPADTVRVLFMFPPSVYNNRFAFSVSSTGAVAQVNAFNTKNPNVSYTSWNANCESYRMSSCSQTIYQDVTALNNAGMFYGAKWRPNVSLFAINPFEFSDPSKYKSFDEFARKYNDHEGFECVKKLINKLTTTKADGKVSESTPALGIQVISLGIVPKTGGEVLMKSPKSESWRSTEGAFFTHHFTEPTQKWMSTSRTYANLSGAGATVSGETSNILNCFEQYVPSTNTWTLTSFTNSAFPNSYDCAHWYDMEWSMLMYDFGANLNITGDGLRTSIVHKKIFTLEVQPVFGSILQALCRQAPYLDTKALDMASITSNAMPDMLPARANALGGFITKAIQYAPTLIGFLKNAFGRPDSSGSKSLAGLANRLNQVELEQKQGKKPKKVKDLIDFTPSKPAKAKRPKATVQPGIKPGSLIRPKGMSKADFRKITSQLV